MPKAFRPKAARRQGLPHMVEWLDELQAEPLRMVLESLATDALGQRDGGLAPSGARRGDREVSEPATFERLVDCTEHPEHLLAVDVDDAVWSFDPSGDGRLEQWGKTVLVPEAGFAARVGDVMLHGDPIAPGPGSPNVFIGGRPALRSCDSLVGSRLEATRRPGGAFVATYPKVEINGFPALRVGDYVNEGPHGLDAIAVGCPSVVIGPRPRPVEGWRVREAMPVQPPDAYRLRWRRGRVGPDERTQVLGAELDGPRAWAEGTARAVRLWAEAPQEDERR